MSHPLWQICGMKINEQLELPLEREKTIQDSACRQTAMMFDTRWWFKKLREAVESAPQWSGVSRPLYGKKQVSQTGFVRYKIV